MPERDLAGWLAYIETVHHREIDMGLERVRNVLQRMKLLPPGYRIIAVGGTNGKGSCVAMLRTILSRGGYRVGAYTSPHLVRYNERIRIGDRLSTDEELVNAFSAIEAARGEIPLTYFEFGTLAAHWCFHQSGVDVAIMEVGMGGRLDAVNVIEPDAALITNVGLDHQRWLGETRDEIGREKAGILHTGRPAVYADPDPVPAVMKIAEENHVSLIVAGRDYEVRRSNEGWEWRFGDKHNRYPVPALPGAKQIDNAAAVVTLLALIAGQVPVSQEAIRGGLREVRLAGRLQQIGERPMQIVDVAHNLEAAEALAHYLEANPVSGRTIAVAGMLADKPAEDIFKRISPQVDEWWLGGLGGSRGRSASELAAALRQVAPEVEAHLNDNVIAAYEAALAAAKPEDRIIAFGSFYTVGDILADLHNPPN